MLLVIEVVIEFKEVLLVQVLAISIDESQKLDLVHRLVEVVLVVFDDFHAHHLLRVDVIALDGLREGC